MHARHPKANHWLRKGLFDSLSSFTELEARVNQIPEEKDRGDIFEIFVEGYLATQPITQCVRHWVVGDIPLALRERYRLPPDATGIDGIYEIHDGTHVAYQVKYRQATNLTFAEVAPFLGITEQFSDRVIFTNAASLSDKALQRARWVSREAFLDLPQSAFEGIEAWLKERPAPITRALPDPRFQVQALSDIERTLSTHDRATVVMACGTGKTLVALWAAERQTPKSVLVLVPSLTLLKQTLLEWSEQTTWGRRFSYLCVCSDTTVGLKDDAWDTDKTDVGFRIDTDPKVVHNFLGRETDDVKVIFSTYQSSPVVGEGAKTLPPFDLAIFDEAHKTTGHVGTAFTYALSDKNIRIRKRLFFTATPRHVDIRHRDKEGEWRVSSMNDETIYGPRAHTLSFAEAANKGIICRYKVIISLIDKEAVTDFARKHGLTVVEQDEVATRWVANLVALVQAIDRVKANKIITFHSRVRLAQEFAANAPRGIAFHLTDHDVRHVNGEQSSAVRAEVIRAFADEPKSLLTNARCLTEGVNIPAVDMVAFIDPRQSRIDVAQAVGRAMRKPRVPTTKTVGYVVVPVFAGMGEEGSLYEAIKSERFDVIADVLNALQEHDEDLSDVIREIRERKGAGEAFNPRRFAEKLQVIGPRVDFARLTESIGIEVAERIGSSWDEWYGRLRRFRNREGHVRVPVAHVEDGLSLGSWVSVQRKKRESMSAERRHRLDAVGFEWDPIANDWENAFAALKKFKEREGHCSVPIRHIEDGLRLGVWVSNQRTGQDSMPSDRKQRLEALGFIWDQPAAAWEAGFASLERFRRREGHCRVHLAHVEDGYRLGHWVMTQRRTRDQLSVDKQKRLDALGFEWTPTATDWEKGFTALEKFKKREGHCRVHRRHIEDGYKLGVWVGEQRKRAATMSVERKQRLDAVGFEWNPIAGDWEKTFAAIVKFKMREGHCRVPVKHVEGDINLGMWVADQRKSPNAMPKERKSRLDEIGFVWDAQLVRWEEAYAKLAAFQSREGHCAVPKHHSENGFGLGLWVVRQRRSRDTMPAERKQRLDALGFVWGNT